MPPRNKQLWCLATGLIVAIWWQLHTAVSLKPSSSGLRESAMPLWEGNSTIMEGFPPLPHLPKDESFGACLMLKEDNMLLHEWISYHFTVLPLRYIYVGSDVGNRQDPEDVLRRWKTANTGLQYWVTNISDIVPPSGPPRASSAKETSEQVAHHDFIFRQRKFITTCASFMKQQGIQWTTFIDSDEFISMNHVEEEEAPELTEPGTNHTIPVEYQIRFALPPADFTATILNVMQQSTSTMDLRPCYTMPRLLYGALENITCLEGKDSTALATRLLGVHDLSTLRFTQHARKGDFRLSKYGKVMMDVSNLTDSTLALNPRNIHRPYKPECRHAVVEFGKAAFVVNHYIGSWERYDSRADSRRNRDEWEMRAYITTSSSCEQGIFHWFPRFVNLVGQDRARFLLHTNEKPS